MSETISPLRFHEFDRRVVREDACGHLRTGSFAAGVALVDAIGRLAKPRTIIPTSTFAGTTSRFD